MSDLVTKFSPRDRVHIDGCTTLVGFITAVQWRHEEVVHYEVSWVTNGKAECALIEGWRLSEADDAR